MFNVIKPIAVWVKAFNKVQKVKNVDFQVTFSRIRQDRFENLFQGLHNVSQVR